MMTSAAPVILRIARRFSHPPERVFDAWLDPASLGRWLFATEGGEMLRVEADPRVGGEFIIVEKRGVALAEHFGRYVEIDRPRRLAFTFSTDRESNPTLVTVDIVPTADGCELTLTHEMDPQWAAYADRAREGWTMILEGLATTLAGSPAGSTAQSGS
jgi:uncharacterized protein YndB with AHSA1/START domain